MTGLYRQFYYVLCLHDTNNINYAANDHTECTASSSCEVVHQEKLITSCAFDHQNFSIERATPGDCCCFEFSGVNSAQQCTSLECIHSKAQVNSSIRQSSDRQTESKIIKVIHELCTCVVPTIESGHKRAPLICTADVISAAESQWHKTKI